MSVEVREGQAPRTSGLKPWEFPEPDWTEESWNEFVAWKTFMQKRDAIPVQRCAGPCHRLILVGTAAPGAEPAITRNYCVTCHDPEHQRKEDEMRDAQLDWRKLQKMLKEQDFSIEKTKSGWRIKAPSGEGIVHIHDSTLSVPGRTNINVLHQLYDLGFKDQRAWKKVKLSKERDPEKFPYLCQYEGCGARFERAMHRGNHEKACAWNPDKAIPATASKNGTPSAGPVHIRSIGEFQSATSYEPTNIGDAFVRDREFHEDHEHPVIEGITLQQAIDRIHAEHRAIQSVIDQNKVLIEENRKLRERLEKFTALIQEGVDLVE